MVRILAMRSNTANSGIEPFLFLAQNLVSQIREFTELAAEHVGFAILLYEVLVCLTKLNAINYLLSIRRCYQNL